MKKLILLLFLPFISVGQDMTYEDLMGFENTQQIERFLIEHNYERFDFDNEEEIKYGYDIDLRDGESWLNKLASINLNTDKDSLSFNNYFGVEFNVDFVFVDEEDYNRIYDVAKKELEFGFVNEGIAYYTGENVMVAFRKKEYYNINILRMKEEEEKE
jgi:hypothetical protein